VADVGQSRWEWVNLVEKGGNYGWNVREGNECFDASDASNAPETCPDETPEDVRGGETLREPILQYPNGRNPDVDTGQYASGRAVVGGYVYRGSEIPALDGLYVFGDLDVSGQLFVGIPPEDGVTDRLWPMRTVALSDDSTQLEQLLGFGRAPDGELYVIGDTGVYLLAQAG